MNGEELFHRLKDRDAGMEVIILTGQGSIDSAFRTGRQGASEYLLKPCDFDDLVSSINNAYARRIKSLGGAAPNAIAYESRQFSSGEFFVAGIPASILLMIVLAIFVWLIWPLMGMPVVAQ